MINVILFIIDSVTHIHFGHNFNQPIEDCIPNSVTHLTIGWGFDQDIKDCIQNSVTELILSDNYSKDIMVHDNCQIIHTY